MAGDNTTETAGKRKRGKPRREFDWNIIEGLHRLFCTDEEIAYMLNTTRETLTSRPEYADSKKKGQALGRISLRRTLARHAETNTGACIFSAKNYLGLSDNPVSAEQSAATAQFEKVAAELMKARNKYNLAGVSSAPASGERPVEGLAVSHAAGLPGSPGIKGKGKGKGKTKRQEPNA